MTENNNYSSLVLILVNFHIAFRLITYYLNPYDITHVEAYGYLLVVYTFIKILYDAYREEHMFIGAPTVDRYVSFIIFIVWMMTYVTEYLAIRIGVYNNSILSQSLIFGVYTGCLLCDILMMTLFPIDSSTKTIHNLVIICRVLIVFTSITGH